MFSNKKTFLIEIEQIMFKIFLKIFYINIKKKGERLISHLSGAYPSYTMRKFVKKKKDRQN